MNPEISHGFLVEELKSVIPVPWVNVRAERAAINKLNLYPRKIERKNLVGINDCLYISRSR